MCGRYQFDDEGNLIWVEFDVHGERPNWMPRISFSPTNHGPFITAERTVRVGHWALIASWEKEGKMLRSTFNARAESVQKLPTFRSAFKHRRCIVPMDAFYEWSGPKTARIPARDQAHRRPDAGHSRAVGDLEVEGRQRECHQLHDRHHHAKRVHAGNP